jgi:hypothetical protein
MPDGHMLRRFLDWAQTVSMELRGKGLDARVTEASGDDSVRLDIDTPTAMARITCWESGAFHSEAIHIESERTIFQNDGVFHCY